ncbi:hypothetical protein [Planktotalea sp.]|uniref:hypothetical protein n=1 Tax=Planktotalea sp. TaxID=2029877 RepID=UPI003296826F
MTVLRIYQALEEFEGDEDARQNAAKAGILEWAMSLPTPSSPAREAKQALLHLEAMPNAASAAGLFVGYLREASHVLPAPVRRGGARARRCVLH